MHSSDDKKWYDPYPVLVGGYVIEVSRPRTVIYDHNGQPYARPRVPMGFIDPNNLPKPE